MTIVAVITLVYFYGYDHSPEEEDFLLSIIKGSFAYYVFHYILRFIYHFHPKQFFRQTWYEGIAMLILLIEGISYNFFDRLLLAELFQSFGMKGFADVSTILIQFYFVVVVLIEAFRASNILPRFKVHPASIFIFTFIIIIMIGTGLLMLPEMTTANGGLDFLSSLFTSTSATCVTGLMVVDASSVFTFKGQLVILILIKLGGLNVIAFGSFIALASKFGVGIKHHDIIEDFVNRDTAISAQGMLSKVFIWAFAIELIGATVLYFFWSNSIEFTNRGERVFYSIFHSVSAFNNAGISLFRDGFHTDVLRHNYLLHWVIVILIFVGALGMVALFDLFDIRNLRDRMKNPWKTISFPTKIALYTSLILIAFGAISFFFLDYNHTIQDHDIFGKITSAVFQSVTTRTCGFNTVDINSIALPTLLIFLFLMFIGASSSSTGGGIKTSTLAIVYADMMSTIKGFNHTQLFKRTIPSILRSRAYAILLFYLLGNLVCILLLTLTETEILAQPGRDAMDLIFEEVSALATVGLSTGITADLSVPGKYIVIVSMLVGRVGTLTVAYALAGKIISKDYKYPEGHTMVG